MQTQFIQKFLLFSKRGFHNAWNQKYFQTQFIMKSYLPFDLRFPKKMVITVKNLWMGIDLESDDLTQKIYFHNLVEHKRWHISKAFFEKMNSLKIKHFEKIHYF